MYFKSLEENNITYSVDMIRLKTYITFETFSKIEFKFATVYKSKVERKYTSAKLSNFFYNYHIVVSEGKSFWFGFLHNMEKRSDRVQQLYNFTIEFNPNKLKDEKCILYLLGLSFDWYIISYDFAFDLKININDVLYDQKNKRHIEIFMNSYDDKTYRIGKGDGRIKIYNKKKESKLDIAYELTRIEVSRNLDNFSIKKLAFLDFDEKYLPKVYLNEYIYSLSDYKDKTLYALIYAVQNGFPIKELSRKYRDKIESLFKGCEVIFNKKTIVNVLRDTFQFYFRNNPYIV